MSSLGVHKKLLGYPTPKDRQLLADSAETLSKLYLVFDVFSITTLGFVKLSAVFFYRRIFCFPGKKGIFNVLTLGTIFAVALWIVAFLLLSFLQCGTHFSALWTGARDYARYCRISYPYLLGLTVSDFLFDIWVICLPFPEIWAIRTSLKRRTATTGIFLLSSVGLAACITRLVIFVQIENSRGKVDIDPRLVNTKAIFFSVLEAGFCLIAVNLPSLWFLFSKIKPENILRSVRSMVSIRSERSGSSYSSTAASSPHSFFEKKGGQSNSSERYLTGSSCHTTEVHAMHNVDSVPSLPEGGIRVTDRIDQSNEKL